MAIERSVGLLGSLVGQRRRGVTADVVRLVNDILGASGECSDIKWLLFEDVRQGKLDEGTAAPFVA